MNDNDKELDVTNIDNNPISTDNEILHDEADEAFDKKEKKSKVGTIIRRIILVIAIAVFCYSAYMLINIFLEYKKGDDIYEQIQTTVLEESPITISIGDKDVEIPFKYDHNALLSINKDGIGYMYIPSIGIRLPMVQGSDNDYYLNHAFEGTYNSDGCLFEDYRISGGIDASNVIIYGHSMNNGSMFGQLYKYRSYSFWSTEGNDVIYIYTGNSIKEYKIFSVYDCDPTDTETYAINFTTLSGIQEYASTMKARSLYDTGIDVSLTKQVITLSTCSDNGERRLIVHGTFIGEASLDN